MQPSCCAKPDHPKKGEKVAVIRSEHGWYDGTVTGVITHVYHSPTGGVSYVVQGDDGIEYECKQRSDVKRV